MKKLIFVVDGFTLGKVCDICSWEDEMEIDGEDREDGE